MQNILQYFAYFENWLIQDIMIDKVKELLKYLLTTKYYVSISVKLKKVSN